MFETINDIKVANEKAGHCWFDRETMDFFDSVVYPGVWQGADETYFVSSESNYDSSERRYTVRVAYASGTVGTASEFLEFASHGAAQEFARKAAAKSARQYRWIAYLHQPAGLGFEVVRVPSISAAVAELEAYTDGTGFYKDLTVYGTYGCTASLYPYSAEDWAEAMEYKDTGNPFDFPSKLIEFGPRGGAKVSNA